MRQDSFMPAAYKAKMMDEPEMRERSRSREGSRKAPSRKHSSASKYSYDKKRQVKQKVDQLHREGKRSLLCIQILTFVI